MTLINAAIDFPEIEEDLPDITNTQKILESDIIFSLNQLIIQHERFYHLKDGFVVVIIGIPNVGKSSLLNSIVNKDRAIISEIPGTTRDFIEESLNICGIPVIITDTAGLCKTNNSVEAIGIKKSYEYLDKADLVLFVTDASICFTKEEIDLCKHLQGKDVFLVLNKFDLVKEPFLVNIPDNLISLHTLKTSALHNQGIGALIKSIEEHIKYRYDFEIKNPIIPNLRHKLILEKCVNNLFSAIECIKNKEPFEVISIDIKETIELFDEILGIKVNNDTLAAIFDRFCIGK
ncbi:MAG: 50S ribosome-binding GTPase [Desulfobacterales bacterium]|nr:50S ribosome-binding GTPase [Desulfobacterales bacterium]